jgi:hypothetical protein
MQAEYKRHGTVLACGEEVQHHFPKQDVSQTFPAHICLGGAVVSVLATGPKGCGLKPGQGDGYFKGDKNPQHTFLWDGK